MKIRLIALISVVLITLLALSSCDLLISQQELSPEEIAQTIVAQTSAPLSIAETIVAQTLAAVEIGENGNDEPAEPTETPLPPTETESEPPTPTITLSPTQSVPVVQVSVNTNCRSGPGLIYDFVTAFIVGQEAEVIARTEDSSYWVIQNPAGAGQCWLWGNYATVEGPIGDLPVWEPPPTPTPKFTDTPEPTVYKSGSLEITETERADLDEGVIMGGASSDLWFEVVAADQKYLTPENGATMAVWGGTEPDMYDCLEAAMGVGRIPLANVPVGTYVCYLTNEGRPGVFRVNALTLPTITIGFTTWNAP